jgi:hypothetical protein
LDFIKTLATNVRNEITAKAPNDRIENLGIIRYPYWGRRNAPSVAFSATRTLDQHNSGATSDRGTGLDIRRVWVEALSLARLSSREFSLTPLGGRRDRSRQNSPSRDYVLGVGFNAHMSLDADKCRICPNVRRHGKNFRALDEALNLARDIAQSAKAATPLSTSICLRNLLEETFFIEHDLYGTYLTSKISSQMEDPADEALALDTAKLAASAIPGTLPLARSFNAAVDDFLAKVK